MLKIDACTAAKHKIILSWPYSYFEDHKKNMFKTLKGIKLLININKKDNKTVICLSVDRAEETDLLLVSKHFNMFFFTIAQKIEDKVVSFT